MLETLQTIETRGEGQKGELPYFIEVFLEIPHEAAQKKNLDVYLSFANKPNICYNIIA